MEIKYNIHIKNADSWPAVNRDGEFIGNYAEWEAEKWEADNGDMSPEVEAEIDKQVAAMVRNGLGYFSPGEILDQKIVIIEHTTTMSELGRKGGSAPHNRPKDYFSAIAKLPRKRKSDKL